MVGAGAGVVGAFVRAADRVAIGFVPLTLALAAGAWG